jgi:outer membrane lipoprotein-sorting protein
MKSHLAVFILLVSVTTTYSQTVDGILKNYFAKIGGADKWRTVKTIKSIGKLTIQGTEVGLITYQKSDGKKRGEITAPGMQIIRTYNGKESWMLNPSVGNDPIALNEEQAKDFAEDDFQDPFIDYKKKGHEVTLLGTEELDGIKCFKVQIILNKNNEKEDAKQVNYFDSETYLPMLEIVFKLDPESKQVMEIYDYSGDFHEVNGLMFPFYHDIKYKGQTVQKITLEKIVLDEPMDDSLFTLARK